VKDIGYEQDGFHWETADVQNYLHEQSADIAQGVDEGSGSFKMKARATRASCSALPVTRRRS
jgi:S-adenosylmethionine synthetase